MPFNILYQAYNEGRNALLLSGRNLRDLDCYPKSDRIGPLLGILRQVLREQYGMALISYSRAEGLDYDRLELKESDRQVIETTLKTHNLLNIPQNEQELVQIFRGIAGLSRTSTQNLKWSNGQEMRFCLLLQFGEHLTPNSPGTGLLDCQLIAAELSHITAQSLALRSSGNLLIFHTHDESLIYSLVRSALHPIRLPQPDRAAKQYFIQGARQIYTQATLELGLNWEQVAFLCSNTPNRGLESLLRASHRSQRPLTARELVAQKSADVQTISEQTLTVLDTSRVSVETQLRGVNSAFPQSILKQLAKALAQGNPQMPANVLLVGPPGTGKTEMCQHTAKLAGVAAYQMHSPKRGIVGETERLADLQQRVLREWIPNLAFVDEITEALPLERSDFDGDSGATKAVAATLLTALADETRRGVSMLLATTNCPWRMGAAMRSRFTMIPVLHPLPEDYPAIIIATAEKITSPDRSLSPSDPDISTAARIFYAKKANPRHIRAALSNALLLKGTLTPAVILFAAHDCSLVNDEASSIYSDLWAIAVCSSHSFFPWSSSPELYPFPPHLQGLVNLSSGEIDRQELQKRIKELEPHANL
jgi:hypothetical protein